MPFTKEVFLMYGRAASEGAARSLPCSCFPSSGPAAFQAERGFGVWPLPAPCSLPAPPSLGSSFLLIVAQCPAPAQAAVSPWPLPPSCSCPCLLLACCGADQRQLQPHSSAVSTAERAPCSIRSPIGQDDGLWSHPCRFCLLLVSWATAPSYRGPVSCSSTLSLSLHLPTLRSYYCM